MVADASAPAWDEADRLAALDRYAILDTAREREFDDIVRIAAQICKMPMALISLVDDKRQWFKAAVGLDAPETPRSVAFCAHAIQQRAVFMVRDATADDRFAANPLVTGDPNLRFYAGAPLETSDGFPLGTLCVLDTRPGELSEDQILSLQALARQVVTHLELRQAIAKHRADEEHRRLLVDELQHRIKNTLAVVQAIVSQSLRTAATPNEAREAIGDRLAGLAQAHDLLTRASWTEASIVAIINGAIRIHGDDQERIFLRGPDIKLTARPALALAMAMHELCTNAAKYGALSNEIGRVDINWGVTGDGADAPFELSWQESGGPTVTPPTTKGFGSRLIETSLARDLRGETRIAYRPDGVCWTWTSTRDAIQEG